MKVWEVKLVLWGHRAFSASNHDSEGAVSGTLKHFEETGSVLSKSWEEFPLQAAEPLWWFRRWLKTEIAKHRQNDRCCYVPTVSHWRCQVHPSPSPTVACYLFHFYWIHFSNNSLLYLILPQRKWFLPLLPTLLLCHRMCYDINLIRTHTRFLLMWTQSWRHKEKFKNKNNPKKLQSDCCWNSAAETCASRRLQCCKPGSSSLPLLLQFRLWLLGPGQHTRSFNITLGSLLLLCYHAIYAYACKLLTVLCSRLSFLCISIVVVFTTPPNF